MIRRAPDALLIAALLIGGAVIGHLGRFWSFFYDEWGTIFYRRSGGFSSFFAAHNGHLQAAVIAIYRLLFATVGLRSYHPYQAVMIAAHLTLVALLYVYARRRVGPWAALLAVLPLLLLAYAYQVIFWAINLGFVFPIIALVLLLLWRHPLLTAAATALALSSSGLGVAVAAGALLLAVDGSNRVKHVAAWTVPVVLYAIWWLAYRPTALPPAGLRIIPGAARDGDVGSISFPLANLHRVPGYVLHSAKATANALIGTQDGGWWMLVAVSAAILATLVVRRRRSVRAAALALTLLIFWFEVAFTRAQYVSPESLAASRYLYPGAFLLVLLLVEAFDGVCPRAPMIVGLAVGVAFVLASDIRALRQLGHDARTLFAAQTVLLERVQRDPRLGADVALDPATAPGVTVGPYRAAVRALGSPVPRSLR